MVRVFPRPFRGHSVVTWVVGADNWKTNHMKPGIPWSVKGIEPEAREAAKIAARNALVAAEMRHPTKQEIARERREIEMSNRGLRK